MIFKVSWYNFAKKYYPYGTFNPEWSHHISSALTTPEVAQPPLASCQNNPDPASCILIANRTEMYQVRMHHVDYDSTISMVLHTHLMLSFTPIFLDLHPTIWLTPTGLPPPAWFGSGWRANFTQDDHIWVNVYIIFMCGNFCSKWYSPISFCILNMMFYSTNINAHISMSLHLCLSSAVNNNNPHQHCKRVVWVLFNM